MLVPQPRGPTLVPCPQGPASDSLPGPPGGLTFPAQVLDRAGHAGRVGPGPREELTGHARLRLAAAPVPVEVGEHVAAGHAASGDTGLEGAAGLAVLAVRAGGAGCWQASAPAVASARADVEHGPAAAGGGRLVQADQHVERRGARALHVQGDHQLRGPGRQEPLAAVLVLLHARRLQEPVAKRVAQAREGPQR